MALFYSKKDFQLGSSPNDVFFTVVSATVIHPRNTGLAGRDYIDLRVGYM